jgi:ribosome-associated protein
MAEAEPFPGPSGLPARDTPARVSRRRTAPGADETTAARPRRPRRAKAAEGAEPPEAESEEERQAQREALQLARRVVDLASDKKASDIVLLEVRALTTLTDYFVICSGGSERQLGAIADGIAEGLKAQDMLPIGREGGASAHWLLLDYGSVIVHIMATPEREYYALEKLWADAPLLLHVL